MSSLVISLALSAATPGKLPCAWQPAGTEQRLPSCDQGAWHASGLRWQNEGQGFRFDANWIGTGPAGQPPGLILQQSSLRASGAKGEYQLEVRAPHMRLGQTAWRDALAIAYWRGDPGLPLARLLAAALAGDGAALCRIAHAGELELAEWSANASTGAQRARVSGRVARLPADANCPAQLDISLEFDLPLDVLRAAATPAVDDSSGLLRLAGVSVAEIQLRQWADEGWITLDAERARTVYTLHDGHHTLNGHAVTIDWNALLRPR